MIQVGVLLPQVGKTLLILVLAANGALGILRRRDETNSAHYDHTFL